MLISPVENVLLSDDNVIFDSPAKISSVTYFNINADPAGLHTREIDYRISPKI
jgi:hypothetical protein